jgi:hypothetical protein
MKRTINYTKFSDRKTIITLTQKKKCLMLFYELSGMPMGCRPTVINSGNLACVNTLISKLGITDEDIDCFRLELGRRMREKSLMILAGQTKLRGFLYETNEAL